MNLDTNITNIYGVGATIAKRLKLIGIATAGDLLFYWPYRYDDFSNVTPIEKLVAQTSANVVGEIELIQNRQARKKRMYITEALVFDKTEQLKVIWFNQPFIAKSLKVGDKVSLSGKIEDGPTGRQMTSPVYEKIIGSGTIHTQGLVPNYHLTANITQKQIRYLVKQALVVVDQIDDWLPKEIIKSQNLIDLPQAIKKIHFPQKQADIAEAGKRLAFNELFLLQLESLLIKAELKNSKAHQIKFKEKENKQFVNSLPFKLTDAQRKSAWEIIQDMGKKQPMARLLEGDVGSGKTVVAVMAMYNTAINNRQSVLMVPTEILAHQHYVSISKLLKPFNLPIGLVTGSKKAITHNPDDMKIDSSFVIQNSAIVIGTHALIQKNIEFEHLALAIIDEQHRFGVAQRKLLTEKSGDKKTIPHLLSMTATPIPRSLALALYGDLDLSIINELPKGRKKISTHVVPENKRAEAYGFIRKEINKGRQIFVICPLIDISDKLGVKSVREEYKKLNEQIFPDLDIAMLHGRLKSSEKEKIMQNFLDNKSKLLVSTSVVEVGVDVPNATIMMIEGAERFGLAQLHQFRGRVGRSEHQSYCFLFTDSASPQAISRLSQMSKFHNGFDLAKADLKFRGPGEVYGTAQKGFPELKMASIFDLDTMKQARDEAEMLIKEDKSLKKHPKLKEKIGKIETKHLE